MDQSLQFFFTGVCFQSRQHITMCLCVFVPGGVWNQYPLCVCAESQQQKSLGPEPQRGSVSALLCLILLQISSTGESVTEHTHSRQTEKMFWHLKNHMRETSFHTWVNCPSSPRCFHCSCWHFVCWHLIWDIKIRQVKEVMCWFEVWGFRFPTV